MHQDNKLDENSNSQNMQSTLGKNFSLKDVKAPDTNNQNSNTQIPYKFNRRTVSDLEDINTYTSQDYKNLYYEAKNEIHQKEVEIIELKYKIDQMNNQKQVDLMPTYYKIKKNYINKLKYDFPEHNKVKSENEIRELYTKLLIYYNELYVDREQTLDSLKLETINNEEQKVYIEMLKESLSKSFDPKGSL